MKNTKSIYLFILFSLFVFQIKARIQDSIGIEKKDGKTFVLHQVDAKETLFSIARRYSAKVDEIRSSNPEVNDGLKIGQTLKIPYKNTAVAIATSETSNKKNKEHIVESKETLFSISKKYNVSVDDIIKFNPGIENGIKEGQTVKIPVENTTVSSSENQSQIAKSGKIHNVEPKETLFGISKKYGVSVDALKQANPDLINGLKEGMELTIPSKVETKEVPAKNNTSSTKEKEEVKNETVINSSNNSKGEFKKVTENGIAELMESRLDSPKFHALHKSAPTGTIVQVVNESNGQKIFVRVIGKLTDTSDSKVIIKISQKAMERLEASDKRISVSLSYIP